MYLLARLMLIAAVGMTGLAAFVFCTGSPVMLIVGICLLACLVKKMFVGRNRLHSHGTARWASQRDLARAGMLGGKEGLMLGRLVEVKL